MTKGKKPLDGVKVIDFTRVYAGPYCTMMLGDLGAEVIKIEKQGTGDDTHDFAPVKDGESGYFTYLNRNKKSLSLNLKAEKAIGIIKELAKWADIVVENFSPGVVDRLGVGYNDLKAINPRIIYGSISGFGQTGPYSQKPAYDLVCQAMGGYMTITGEADGKPYKLGTSIADASAGIHMAYALMAALYDREKTGVGQFIDVAMMDTVFSTLENFVVTKTLTGIAPSRNGNANLGSAPFNLYNTKDGYVTIACANNKLFEKLTTAIGESHLLNDPRYKENSLRKKNRC
jgi:CoA:oxalate CoA-transferase